MSSSSSMTHRVAVAQLTSTFNKLDNLRSIAKCAGEARAQKATMLFLPENCGFVGVNAAETLANAEPAIDPSTGKQKGGKTTNPDLVAKELTTVVDSNSTGNEMEKSAEQNGSHSESEYVYLLDGLRTIARASNLWISVGGIHERGAPSRASVASTDKQTASASERIYNTHVILDNVGEVKAVYRKVHLFDVSIPGKVDLQESVSTAPGTKLVTCGSPVGR